MNRLFRFGTALAVTLALLAGCDSGGSTDPRPLASSRQAAGAAHPRLDLAGLPQEVGAVIERIDRGGPFPYRKDGSVFQNRERRLPGRPTGYYREYTVPTPGESTRGARRIVTGGHPPEVYYYTHDHYRSFQRIPERR
jgi:guanyl-specific ribonuclease Sa